MPEDEVAELEAEADAEGKSRSEHIRSVLRARHFHDKLDDQVITKQEKEEMEETIKRLKRERDEYEEQMRVARTELESMEETIETTTDKGLQAVSNEYRRRIRELEGANKRLREENNTQVSENMQTLLAASAPPEQVEDLEEKVEELAERQWQGTIEQREAMKDVRADVRNDLREEIRHSRPLTIKALDWIRSRLL